MKAIYIESEMFLRRMLEEIFSREGHEITTLEAPEDTLHFVRDLAPDVMILDVATLGEMWERYREEVDQVSQIPVVALTYPDKGIDLTEKQKQKTRTHVIEKPFRVDQIFEKIFRATKGRSPHNGDEEDREASNGS